MQPGTETLCVSVGEIISMQGIAAAYDESPMLHHVVADYISFATAFFIAYVKAFSHSFHRSSFPHKADRLCGDPESNNNLFRLIFCIL